MNEELNIGYKAMNADMTCNGCYQPFQYEIGKTYEIEGELEMCNNGFHFCENIFNTLMYYYNIEGDKRFFKIKYNKCIDDVNKEKSVTNKIKILEEVNIYDFINENLYNDEWIIISNKLKLSEDLIRKYQNKLNWYYISKYQNLSESFIEEFQNKVDWCEISRSQNLSESFIREFKDKVDWCEISIYQQLSEDFIRKFKDSVDWIQISRYQTLSENFIREFQDKVDWFYISVYQVLSESFIREFKDKVYWNCILLNNKLMN